ncbi:MAG: glycosyltransferase [Chloroflexaceae bacterium]|nr:glycosyltransferase [Chloroflexaceae bacterium]
MHILQIYKDYYPVLGGIENDVRAMAEGLVARGHRVTVLVTSTTAHTEREQHGPLTIIKTARWLHLASTPLSPAMVHAARQLRDVDLVILYFPYPPGDLAAMAVPGQPPLVVRYHSDIVRQRWLLKAYGPLLQHTLDHAQCILPNSESLIATSPWLAPRAERCTVLPLSVDLERFAHPDPQQINAIRQHYGQPLLLFVGRLRYYKGLPFLLAAMAHLPEEVQLLIVGSGPEEPALRSQVQAAGLGQRVHLVGEVDDMHLPAFYAAADIFVLPSHVRAEAFGIVMIEAQAAGLPLVCTELGTGTSYVNQHGQTGFVVPPANSLALARALQVLLHNPNLARAMGQRGMERANTHFSKPAVVQRLEQICATLV